MKLIITKNDLSKIIGRFIIQLNTGENEVQYLTDKNCNLNFYFTKRIYFIHYGENGTICKTDLYGYTFSYDIDKFLNIFNYYKYSHMEDKDIDSRYHRLLTSEELDILFKFLKERNY